MATIDMSQVNALSIDLGHAGARIVPLARVVIAKTGTDTVADAKILAPVDTGFLQGSIGMDLDADGLGFTAGPTAGYGGFVEDGTSRMAAQPYMGPAFDRRVPAAVAALAQAAEEAVGGT